MRRIFYVVILLFCFKTLHSLDVEKIRNKLKVYNHHKSIFDVSENDNRHSRHKNFSLFFKEYKWRVGDEPPNRRRAQTYRPEKDISSSIEKMKYHEEFKELHKKKKQEAFDTSASEKDVVNMVAARPWGVPCGDPDQHDMPWGSCMTPEECDEEYRIYRGDYFCGRTTFVCCALQITTYDLYGPRDASLGGSDFEVPLGEKLVHEKHTSANKGKKSRKRDENRRQREEERRKRKKRMKKIIRRIVREIERTFKNETNIKKDKTRQFKKFLKQMKHKYHKSRLLVRDQHRVALNKTDREGDDRLKKIYEMNKEFIRNLTDFNYDTKKRQLDLLDAKTVPPPLPRSRVHRRPIYRDTDFDYLYG